MLLHFRSLIVKGFMETNNGEKDAISSAQSFPFSNTDLQLCCEQGADGPIEAAAALEFVYKCGTHFVYQALIGNFARQVFVFEKRVLDSIRDRNLGAFDGLVLTDPRAVEQFRAYADTAAMTGQ